MMKNARLIAVILVAVVVLAGIVSIVYSPRNETLEPSSITRSQSYDNSSNAEILFFALGLTLLPFIFYPILGFGDAVYDNS